MNIADLKRGMKKVDVQGQIIEIAAIREVMSRYTSETYKVATAIIQDETGKMKLSLWNEDIGRVKKGDTVRINNGHVTAFRGEVQLNVGKRGTMEVL